MVVKIKGIEKLNSNWFEEIMISEDTKNCTYYVRVLNNCFKFDGEKFNTSFSDYVKGLESEEAIIEIIERYLENVKVNGLTTLLNCRRERGKWVYIYGNNSFKVLRTQMFNVKFKEIFQKIKNKYLNDRYEFFWSDDIKKIKLSLDSKKSCYNVYPIECEDCDRTIICSEDKDAIPTCETYVDYSVKVDKEKGLPLFEKKFITELLNYKFSQACEEIQVKSFNLGKTDKIDRYIVSCGDFEISFLNREVFMFILDMVNDYNNELYEIKKNEKKRQLKMEGF